MEYLISAILIICSGLFSGLTIGLSSIPKDDMQRLAANGDIKAKKILPVIKDYNLLLVTLLLGNTVVNVLLTNYLGSIIGTGIMTVAISTAAILVFGEITPAAVITRHSMTFGAFTAPLVSLIIKIFYPIAKPIAYTLNKLLGGDDIGNIYTKDDFRYIIDQHTNDKDSEIDEQDGRIMKGVFALQETPSAKNATKRRDVYSIDYKTLIDDSVISEIAENGYTRIPVIKDSQVIGIINTKRLLKYDTTKQELAVDIMESDKYLTYDTDVLIDDILQDMIDASVHMAVIVNQKSNMWVGILTMEDILEVLFQKEIYDETDDEEEKEGN